MDHRNARVGGCAQRLECPRRAHPEWRPSCKSPRLPITNDTLRATTFGSFIPGWNTRAESGKPHVPLETRNVSVACNLIASGDGLHRAIAGEQGSFVVRQLEHGPITNGASFYVRLTGPAVLAGTVEQLHRSSWRVSYTAWYPGHYLLELILEYSHNSYVGPWQTNFHLGACYCLRCCTASAINMRLYEGEHVAGSPFVVTVAAERSAPTAPFYPPGSVSCNPNRPIDSAHWVLCDWQRGVVPFEEASWCWRAATCGLLPAEAFTPEALSTCAEGKSTRIVLIGDSVMREQAVNMQQLITPANDTWTLEYKPFYGGVTFPGGVPNTVGGSGLDMLRTIAREERAKCNDRCIIVFNSGAHDVYTRMYGKLHFPRQYRNFGPFNISQYAKAMSQSRDILETIGARTHVFRTTTALWLKYGTSYNFNEGKPKDGGVMHQQRFGEGHNAARAMNEVAAPLFKHWSVVDGYAVTLPRPDEQLDPLHPRPRAFAPMNAQILEIMFQTLCPTKWQSMHT